MTDSGDTSPLPLRPRPTPGTPSQKRPQAPYDERPGTAPWLTESAWAQQVTTPSGAIRRPPRSRARGWARRIFLLVVLLIPLSIVAVAGAVVFEARTAEPQRADAIVVLGAAQYNGRPSEVFQARLDRALELYEDGYAPLIVTTGGNMPGDVYTEAETGEAYLLDRGVPQSAIVLENESRDTLGSLEGVDRVLENRDVDSLLIVSDGFHLLRAELMARELGFTAYGAAALGSPIEPWSGSEVSYVIRETGGIFAIVPRLLTPG